MKHNILITGILLLCLAAIFLGNTSLLAEDNNPASAKRAFFSNQKRPVPSFDHDLHEESLGDTGCAMCHHVLDEDKDELVYSEGEETSCTECHFSESSEDVLALKEANHGSCTVCHRNLIKEKKKAGPTTCGECHKN